MVLLITTHAQAFKLVSAVEKTSKLQPKCENGPKNGIQCHRMFRELEIDISHLINFLNISTPTAAVH